MQFARLARLIDFARGLVSRLRIFHVPGRLGFGRQAALVAARRVFPARAHTPLRRMVSLFAGSLLIGTAVTLLTRANLGLSPHDVFVSGVQPAIGLSFGQTVWVVSGLFFALAAVLGQPPSRWGVAYTLANGFAIDAASGLINAPGSLVGRWLFVAVAMFFLSAGISLVVHSGATGGAFELLMRAGEVRGIQPRRVRTSLEVGVLTSGVALGGQFGPATVVVALTIGPMLQCAGQMLSDHSLGRSVRRLNHAADQLVPEELLVSFE